MLCCGYTLTDFPISIRLTSLALWQSNDCPSASKATLTNMDKYFIWIHYERLHNHNKAKHNKTVCISLGIHCNVTLRLWKFSDFCSRHTVGVAGEDIMFHILVHYSIIIAHVSEVIMFITRDSEVILFSPCVFVCMFVCLFVCRCVYVCHDVCPDDLTMKDWCHTNNILQVHCWGCLVVKVMFHALVKSLVTSEGPKVSQISKLIYLRQYLS